MIRISTRGFFVLILCAVSLGLLVLPSLIHGEEKGEKQEWTINWPSGELKDYIEASVEASDLKNEWIAGHGIEKELFSANRTGKTMTLRGDGNVTFCGGSRGATADIITYGGTYIRVICRGGYDPRPKSTTFCALVTGRIVTVYPKHRVVVLEVKESDYLVLLSS